MYLELTDNQQEAQWFALHQIDAPTVLVLQKIAKDASERMGLLDRTDRVRLQQLLHVLERDIKNVCQPKPIKS